MRSLGEVLNRPEERRNLKTGAVIIAVVCAFVVVIFLTINLNLGLRLHHTNTDTATVQTAQSVD